jgi:SURF1 family
MSTPHPPSSPVGSVEQSEPAWNPGGRNLSYINKAGRRRIGLIGFLLSIILNLSSNLVAMPITSFTLGTWQVHRLKWKTDLIERYSKNLKEEPMILPSNLGYHSIFEIVIELGINLLRIIMIIDLFL